MSPFTLCFIMLLVMYSTMMYCSGNEGNATFKGCTSREKNALLKLKVSFSDPSNRLSSWNTNTDCCTWQGVECDKLSQHVIALDLHNDRYEYDDSASFYANMLSSEMIDSSISELEYLSCVDLSGNDFQGSQIPSFLGLLHELHHLNLSNANFSGVVPHHLGNLSQLNVIDLNHHVYYEDQLVIDDFVWVSRLSLLKHLDMSGINLIQTNDLLEVLNMPPFIKVLRLSKSRLHNRNLGHAFVNASLSNIEQLDLSGNLLDGQLPRFLGNLTSLRDLDLSSNHYSSCNQANLDRLTNLVRLNLSVNSLACNIDSISHVLPNNCHLESLNLDDNSFSGDISNLLVFNRSRCLDHKLATLNLLGNRFYGQLPEQIDSFRMLKVFLLSANGISGPIPTSIGNLTALATLALSENRFNGSIPLSIGNLSALTELDLDLNEFNGPIPSTIVNMRALEHLHLSANLLSGLIPPSIGNLSALTKLGLGYNQLNGDIPLSLWKLSKLAFLDISFNHLESTITETHLSMLSEFRSLWLGGNNLIKFIVGSDWVPPFQLTAFSMRSIHISSGEFPQWLQTQKELEYLDMSNNHIEGLLPDSLCQMKSLRYLDLSNNHIEGSLPDSLCQMKSLLLLNLSNNQIEGSLPDSLCQMKSLYVLHLSNNRLSGNLPQCWPSSLEYLSLSGNNFTGGVPSTLRNCTQLLNLDLSRNGLSGHLPDFFADMSSLRVLILSSNELSGLIPNSIGGAYLLEWLQLNNNSFIGEFPFSLINCTALLVLDVGENSISGKLPKWIGDELVNLRVLRLRSNVLYDKIPRELCQLSQLQMLDLASNKLVGNIPRFFGNFSGMVIYNSTQELRALGSLLEVIKGTALEYFQNLWYLINMDLSNNKLVGEIPLELTGLVALHFLNLSYNHLHGKIPGQIGYMRSLEALDLSNNVLSGSIPTSLSDLTSLSHLNLSHNNLTGAIPIGRQLQTLEDPSIYEGNSCLCGSQLVKKCPDDKASNGPNAETRVADGDEDKVEKIWLYGIITSGFATGFWGVIGVLVLKQSWRHVYFRFTDGVIARILGRWINMH